MVINSAGMFSVLAEGVKAFRPTALQKGFTEAFKVG
jgi:hypothetical protein